MSANLFNHLDQPIDGPFEFSGDTQAERQALAAEIAGAFTYPPMSAEEDLALWEQRWTIVEQPGD